MSYTKEQMMAAAEKHYRRTLQLRDVAAGLDPENARMYRERAAIEVHAGILAAALGEYAPDIGYIDDDGEYR